VGRINPRGKEKKVVTKCYTVSRSWTESLERSRQQKIDTLGS
jgi:hypothetical protein